MDKTENVMVFSGPKPWNELTADEREALKRRVSLAVKDIKKDDDKSEEAK
jgi:hypothetical protein